MYIIQVLKVCLFFTALNNNKKLLKYVIWLKLIKYIRLQRNIFLSWSKYFNLLYWYAHQNNQHYQI